MDKLAIEKEIEKIENQILENRYKIDQFDIIQYVYKILINSAYGALSSRKNPIGDDDIGNAITVMGSTSIQHVNDIVIEFVRGKMISKLESEIVQNPGNVEELKSQLDYIRTVKVIPDVLVANDTDSAMFSLTKCGVKICDGDIVTEEGYELVQECDDYINTEFTKWYERLTNSHNCRLNFKREKICDSGIWLKKANSRKGESEEAKKNYVVHILDNEGVKHPKFKYTGVKFARSVIPADLKKEGKKIVENMLLTQDRQSTDRLVQKLYEYFCEMPIDTKAAIQRCKDIKKYDNGGIDTFILGTPGHVRAALSYNKVINELKLNKYQQIKNGDIAKIVFVTPDNKWGIERMAYLDNWPEEFNEHFKIDNKVMFEKMLFEEIKRFYKSVDWPSFNPTDDYAFSLFDLIEG